MNSVLINNDYELFENGTCFSHKTNKWLKPDINNKGYERLALSIHGKRLRLFTHIKIVEYFGDCKGNRLPPNSNTLFGFGLSIDHRDRNKHNNSRENLELVTHQENCYRKFHPIEEELDF